MATSPTGTGKWKRIRGGAIARAIRDGVTHCPGCGTPLNYREYGQPNSVEVDHIIPRALGGPDHPDNTQVLCRTCNRAKGKKTGAPLKPTEHTLNYAARREQFKHSRTW